MGTFSDLDKLSVKGDNLASHHIPNDNYMKAKGIPREEGIAIKVEEPHPGRGGRHREIHKKLQKQDPKLEPRKALADAVRRVHNVYKNDGLNNEILPSLKKVIKQSKEKHPHLFQKDMKK
ncbi:MAG: hypothetical protein K2X02_08760 [Alphaproteobacteria bacterium]|nr:hypothetical protein [Alphaproteobacteria bacterium]